MAYVIKSGIQKPIIRLAMIKRIKIILSRIKCPPFFEDNIQYPRETIGGKTNNLEIDFITSEEFGFSKELMKQNAMKISFTRK